MCVITNSNYSYYINSDYPQKITRQLCSQDLHEDRNGGKKTSVAPNNVYFISDSSLIFAFFFTLLDNFTSKK